MYTKQVLLIYGFSFHNVSAQQLICQAFKLSTVKQYDITVA